MGKKFMLEVVTPDRVMYSDETPMVIVRTTEGDTGILYDHEPLVAPLKIGSLRVKDDSGNFKWAACSSGFVTVDQSGVKVIVDSAEWVDEIDLERALRAKERAEQRIRKESPKEVDLLRARAALERAINRIRLRELKM
ncbi:F0F1 ATP synthase subunit epsilon [Fusibacter sp. JL298sf-3]